MTKRNIGGKTAKGTAGESRRFRYAGFDEAHPLVREFVRDAPYDFHVGQVLMKFTIERCRGLSPEQIVAGWRERLKGYVAESAKRCYGPSHPEAGA